MQLIVEPKILRRIFVSHTFKAAASVYNSVFKHGKNEQVVEYKFCGTIPYGDHKIGKSDPTLDLQTVIIFVDNCGARINKFIGNFENIITSRDLANHIIISRRPLLVANIYFD